MEEVKDSDFKSGHDDARRKTRMVVYQIKGLNYGLDCIGSTTL